MKNSAIEWTDHTWNGWIGCTKVSPGCAHCYAEAMDHRWGHDSWGPGKPRRRTSAAYWKQPLQWNREFEHEATYDATLRGTKSERRRPRVFCSSLADWLDEEVPIEWLLDLIDLMRCTPNLDWLLLTKRPQNFRPRLESVAAMLRGPMLLKHAAIKVRVRNMLNGWGVNDYNAPEVGSENYWIGTTVEDQPRADERIPQLLAIPARVRFLSCEPLLSAVRLPVFCRGNETGSTYSLPGIHWVICGAESGPRRRPMDLAWARSLRDQCAQAGVPLFVKQIEVHGRIAHDLENFPADLRVREFPRGGAA